MHLNFEKENKQTNKYSGAGKEKVWQTGVSDTKAYLKVGPNRDRFHRSMKSERLALECSIQINCVWKAQNIDTALLHQVHKTAN